MYLLRIGTNEKISIPDKLKVRLGRHKDCEIQFTSQHVSRYHCILQRNGGQSFTVCSTAINNRTFVDTAVLNDKGETAQLLPGSLLGLGIPFSLLNQSEANINYIFLKLCDEGSTEEHLDAAAGSHQSVPHGAMGQVQQLPLEYGQAVPQAREECISAEQQGSGSNLTHVQPPSSEAQEPRSRLPGTCAEAESNGEQQAWNVGSNALQQRRKSSEAVPGSLGVTIKQEHIDLGVDAGAVLQPSSTLANGAQERSDIVNVDFRKPQMLNKILDVSLQAASLMNDHKRYHGGTDRSTTVSNDISTVGNNVTLVSDTSTVTYNTSDLSTDRLPPYSTMNPVSVSSAANTSLQSKHDTPTKIPTSQSLCKEKVAGDEATWLKKNRLYQRPRTSAPTVVLDERPIAPPPKKEPSTTPVAHLVDEDIQDVIIVDSDSDDDLREVPVETKALPSKKAHVSTFANAKKFPSKEDSDSQVSSSCTGLENNAVNSDTSGGSHDVHRVTSSSCPSNSAESNNVDALMVRNVSSSCSDPIEIDSNRSTPDLILGDDVIPNNLAISTNQDSELRVNGSGPNRDESMLSSSLLDGDVDIRSAFTEEVITDAYIDLSSKRKRVASESDVKPSKKMLLLAAEPAVIDISDDAPGITSPHQSDAGVRTRYCKPMPLSIKRKLVDMESFQNILKSEEHRRQLVKLAEKENEKTQAVKQSCKLEDDGTARGIGLESPGSCNNSSLHSGKTVRELQLEIEAVRKEKEESERILKMELEEKRIEIRRLEQLKLDPLAVRRLPRNDVKSSVDNITDSRTAIDASTSHASTSHASTSHAPASHIPASHTPASHTPASDTPASHTSASHTSASHTPASHTPASHTPASHTPASHTPASHTPASHTPASPPPASQPPASHAPASHAPASHDPASHDPASHDPTSHAPTSHAPTSHAPTSHAPTSHASTSHAPTSHAPTSHAPTSHAPTSHASTSHASTSHASTSHASTSHASTSHASTSHAPASHASTSPPPTSPPPVPHASSSMILPMITYLDTSVIDTEASHNVDQTLMGVQIGAVFSIKDEPESQPELEADVVSDAAPFGLFANSSGDRAVGVTDQEGEDASGRVDSAVTEEVPCVAVEPVVGHAADPSIDLSLADKPIIAAVGDAGPSTYTKNTFSNAVNQTLNARKWIVKLVQLPQSVLVSHMSKVSSSASPHTESVSSTSKGNVNGPKSLREEGAASRRSVARPNTKNDSSSDDRGSDSDENWRSSNHRKVVRRKKPQAVKVDKKQGEVSQSKPNKRKRLILDDSDEEDYVSSDTEAKQRKKLVPLFIFSDSDGDSGKENSVSNNAQRSNKVLSGVSPKSTVEPAVKTENDQGIGSNVCTDPPPALPPFSPSSGSRPRSVGPKSAMAKRERLAHAKIEKEQIDNELRSLTARRKRLIVAEDSEFETEIFFKGGRRVRENSRGLEKRTTTGGEETDTRASGEGSPRLSEDGEVGEESDSKYFITGINISDSTKKIKMNISKVNSSSCSLNLESRYPQSASTSTETTRPTSAGSHSFDKTDEHLEKTVADTEAKLTGDTDRKGRVSGPHEDASFEIISSDDADETGSSKTASGPAAASLHRDLGDEGISAESSIKKTKCESLIPLKLSDILTDISKKKEKSTYRKMSTPKSDSFDTNSFEDELPDLDPAEVQSSSTPIVSKMVDRKAWLASPIPCTLDYTSSTAVNVPADDLNSGTNTSKAPSNKLQTKVKTSSTSQTDELNSSSALTSINLHVKSESCSLKHQSENLKSKGFLKPGSDCLPSKAMSLSKPRRDDPPSKYRNSGKSHSDDAQSKSKASSKHPSDDLTSSSKTTKVADSKESAVSNDCEGNFVKPLVPNKKTAPARKHHNKQLGISGESDAETSTSRESGCSSMTTTKNDVSESLKEFKEPYAVPSLSVSVKIEKGSEQKSDTATDGASSTVKVKQENDEAWAAAYDDEDGDVQIVYSQLDEFILLSSDEEEMMCSQQDITSEHLDESSYGPLPLSPENDLKDLFQSFEEEDAERDLLVEDSGEDLEEDQEPDEGLPGALSQSFYEEDDDKEEPADEEGPRDEPLLTIESISTHAEDDGLGTDHLDLPGISEGMPGTISTRTEDDGLGTDHLDLPEISESISQRRKSGSRDEPTAEPKLPRNTEEGTGERNNINAVEGNLSVAPGSSSSSQSVIPETEDSLFRDDRPSTIKAKASTSEHVMEKTCTEPAIEKTCSTEPVIEKTCSTEPVKEKISSKERVIEKTSSREPVKEKTSSRESVKEKTSSREPVKEKTSIREPVKEKASSTEPVKEKTSSKECVIEKSSSREPEIEKTSSRESVIEKTFSREPVTGRTSSREPVIEKTSSREPEIEKTSSRESVIEKTSSREPVTGRTSSREAVIEQTSFEDAEDFLEADELPDLLEPVPSCSSAPPKQQPFRANQPRRFSSESADGSPSRRPSSDLDGLTDIVRRVQRKHIEKSSLLTDAIVPPSRRKGRQKNESSSASSVPASAAGSSSSGVSRKDRSKLSKSKQTSPNRRKQNSSGINLRKSLTKTFDLKIIGKSQLERNQRLPEEASSSSSTRSSVASSSTISSGSSSSSTRQSSHTRSSAGTSKTGGSSTRKDHRIDLTGFREEENISVLKKDKVKSSRTVVSGTAKMTKKNRSHCLTEVNLFPSPNLGNQRIKSKVPKNAHSVDSNHNSEASSDVSSSKSEVSSTAKLPAVASSTKDCSGSSARSSAVPTTSKDDSSSVIISNTHCVSIGNNNNNSSSNAGPTLLVDNLVDNYNAVPMEVEEEASDNEAAHRASVTSSTPSSAGAPVQPRLDTAPPDASASNHMEGVAGTSNGSSLGPVSSTTRIPGGILRLGSSDRGRVKKSIRFPEREEELVLVRYISPRKAEDKLGPSTLQGKELALKMKMDSLTITLSSKVVNNVNSFYLNRYYFIQKVCTWNYDWLKQYHKSQIRSGCGRPPPLLGPDKKLVYPTLILYESFKDYYEVFNILLFYEVWENIYRDWQKFMNTVVWFKCEVDVVKHNFNPGGDNRDGNGKECSYNFTQVKLITLINHIQEKQSLHPRQGSLIAITVPVKGKSSVLFGYVEHQMRYTRTMVSKALKDAIPNATTTLILTVLLSKGNATQISQGLILNATNVSYLKPNIRIWDALTGLPNSELSSYVLKPGIQCVTPPSRIAPYIIPELPLNESQELAVTRVSSSVLCDKSPRIALIHGPPGTGKTRTIVALVAQLFRRAKECNLRSRILLCAPSNAAVDELTRRLVDLASSVNIKLNVVRNGFPGRQCVDRVVQERSLDTLVEKRLRHMLESPQDERSRHELQRMTDMVVVARSEMMLEFDPKRKKRCQDRVVELTKRKSQFEKDCRQHLTPPEIAEQRCKMQRHVLLNANVITSTLGSCCNEAISNILKNEVSVCIVDEAGQCKETDTWLPLLTGVCKLVLAGDHMQLPPTVLSQLAQGKNMKQSLFERVYYHVSTELNRPELVHSLNVQYRMHPCIAHFPSQHFYRGELLTEPSLEKARMSPFEPYLVFDVMNGGEQCGQNAGALRNPGEAQLLAALLTAIAPMIKDKTVGVITPYQSQKACLEQHLASVQAGRSITINTVDAFQGQEKDIILFSCVRAGSGSGSSGGIGFLSQQERLNVALTRARLCLVLVGCVSFLGGRDPAWGALMTDAMARGKVTQVRPGQVCDGEFLKGKLLRR